MKTLIIYASKTGTTEKCAGILGQNLKNSTIINLATIQNESIDKYDLIIIGSPIRMGMIDKRVKKFISKNFNYSKKILYNFYKKLFIFYFVFLAVFHILFVFCGLLHSFLYSYSFFLSFFD